MFRLTWIDGVDDRRLTPEYCDGSIALCMSQSVWAEVSQELQASLATRAVIVLCSQQGSYERLQGLVAENICIAVVLNYLLVARQANGEKLTSPEVADAIWRQNVIPATMPFNSELFEQLFGTLVAALEAAGAGPDLQSVGIGVPSE